jgi:hypothetical protein
MHYSYFAALFYIIIMAMSNPLPDVPSINLTFPSTPLTLTALSYTKKHASVNTVNHCVRSAYWALIIAKKHPAFAGKPLDMDVLILSILLHDMGWATTKSLLSQDKRFEVDGAEIARAYLLEHTGQHGMSNAGDSGRGGAWDKRRLQLVWDAIALHTTPSIAAYKEPEVALAQTGIMADFFGPNFPGGLITVEEYKAVASLFPRVGFKEELRQIMCGLCRDKPSTTFDNFVGEFGLLYGLDGLGTLKDKYEQEWEENRVAPRLEGALDALAEFE